MSHHAERHTSLIKDTKREMMVMMDWKQSCQEVIIRLNPGQKIINLQDVRAAFTDTHCVLQLPEGAEWTCHFHEEIEGSCSKIQYKEKGNFLQVILQKKIPLNKWSSLQKKEVSRDSGKTMKENGKLKVPPSQKTPPPGSSQPKKTPPPGSSQPKKTPPPGSSQPKKIPPAGGKGHVTRKQDGGSTTPRTHRTRGDQAGTCSSPMIPLLSQPGSACPRIEEIPDPGVPTVPPQHCQQDTAELLDPPATPQDPPATRQHTKIPPLHGKIPPLLAKIPPLHGKIPPLHGKIPPQHGKIPPQHGKIPPLLAKIPPLLAKIPPLHAKIPPLHGKIPPLHGKIPPLLAKIPPQHGKIPPLHGKIPPLHGKIPPQLGKIPPQLGKISPLHGKIPPQLGKIPPQLGKISPLHGKIPPQLGKISPLHGKIPPQLGKIPPQLGKISPLHGKIPPQLGMIPPLHGKIPPLHGKIPPQHDPPVIPVTQEDPPVIPVTQEDPSEIQDDPPVIPVTQEDPPVIPVTQEDPPVIPVTQEDPSEIQDDPPVILVTQEDPPVIPVTQEDPPEIQEDPPVIPVTQEDPPVIPETQEDPPEIQEDPPVIPVTQEDPPVIPETQEDPPVISVDPPAQEDLYVTFVKNDFYEKGNDLVVVHVYVKLISKESSRVLFREKDFTLIFKTSDQSFLRNHPGCGSDTLFRWQVKLRNLIDPDLCKFNFTGSRIDISLQKKQSQRWGGLEAPTPQGAVGGAKVAMPASPAPLDKAPPGSNALCSKEEKPRPEEKARATTDNLKSEPQLPSTKPTCMVPPMTHSAVSSDITQEEEKRVCLPGFTGLVNLGNTCFMNSVIQSLSNTRELRDYFQDHSFESEINCNNPLGTGGRLAVSFAVLLRSLWKGTHHAFQPSKLKAIVASKAGQFTGCAQHDAQEFMAFLLDGLHEDLNRIHNKPNTDTEDNEGRPDEEVAEEAWLRHKMRNDSFVVDLFQGQYKSKLVCPVCAKVSITFDPFLYLPVPLPQKQKVLTVFYFAKEPHRKPVK
ncbi:uncharacterized protein ACMZJ9_022138, partial [Mantella aurantiaca]